MRNIGWNILVLSFALIDSAQVPKKCPAPPEYPHTRLSSKHSGVQTFVSGQKVYYDCGEDFTPSRGSRAAECVSGKWTKLTLKCEKKSCGNAGDLPNGEFQYEGNSFLGEKVYAVCNEGYSVKGLDYMICKRSGWTGDFPSCEEGVASCPAPAVANSVSGAGDVRVHRLGASVTVTCGQGFQLEGAQRITCGPGGLWQPDPPLCRPSSSKTPDSDAGRCGVPVTHSNASLADKYITLTSFASGVRVHYVCDVGYVPAGGSRYRRCIMGSWTPLLLKCERKPCGSAGEIVNGQFLYTGVEFGDAATAVCDEGHHLVGQATRTCMSQGWDGRVPTCEAVVCAKPLSGGKNAEMIFPQEPPYTYRTVIRYHCSAGTLIGPSHIWCTEDGRWSNLPPRCEEMMCSTPNVANAYWMGDRNLYQSRDTISIECNRGYVRTGPGIITCGADGRWSPGLPRCTSRRRNWRG